MTTVRETALGALKSLLDGVGTARGGMVVLRNPSATIGSTEVSASTGGIIVMRDGVADTEVLLSPRRYLHSQAVEVEVTAEASPDVAAAAIDAVLAAVQATLDADPTLGGAVDDLEAAAPSIDVAPAEGSTGMAQASFTVTLEYTTTGPLA